MINEPPADVRDMSMAHTMCRREIRPAPELVRAVPGADVAPAATAAGHVWTRRGPVLTGR
ncbi:hypothetical protein [Streptomyces sp. NPDC059209]|uniref:hypothetical protein n=1 Tax=Streptomyces sp. NPDC059209 TaxID=3346769 RepID=UPI0036821A42